MIINPVQYSRKKLPELVNPGTAADLLAGKQLLDQYGNPLTGTMPQKSASDLTASGATVTVPAGYYPSLASKSVATANQATPSISVSSSGLITASAEQAAGYVEAGTKSATRQLTTQSGTTITPGTSRKTAVSSDRYTTGAVYVAGDSNLVASNIKSGVSIFGVIGTSPSQNFASGSISVTKGSSSPVTINVDFEPNYLFLFADCSERLDTGNKIFAVFASRRDRNHMAIVSIHQNVFAGSQYDLCQFLSRSVKITPELSGSKYTWGGDSILYYIL